MLTVVKICALNARHCKPRIVIAVSLISDSNHTPLLTLSLEKT